MSKLRSSWKSKYWIWRTTQVVFTFEIWKKWGQWVDKIRIADEFTTDGCRLWDSETLKKMDKDRVRQGLGDVVEAYHQVADKLGMNIETWLN